MNAIQEALRELNTVVEAKKTRKVRAFDDLFDQVYCSLTDGGADSAYQALGDMSGKGVYDVYDITTSDVRPGFDTIIVNTDQPDAALKVAEIYELETKVVPGRAVYVYIPEGAPVRDSVLAKNKVAAADTVEEDFNSSMPVQPLDRDTVYDFIASVPVAGDRVPPKFFPIGYMREMTSQIKSEYKGGRRSTGETSVRILKCTEMTVWTGTAFENTQAVKDMRKETGKERSGSRSGFNYNSDTAIASKIGVNARGEEQLACYIKNGTRPKVKYFISINDGDLIEATKQDVAQYLTDSNAAKLLSGSDDKPLMLTLKLSQIYKIGPHGVSVM